MIRRKVFVTAVLFTLVGIAGWTFTQSTARSRNEHMVLSVLWFQTAAEMRALAYQAFNLAAIRLDEDMRANSGRKKRAVVVDIDETVLDNSPHMGKLIAENESFPYAWKEWVDAAQAEPLPGALEFLRSAAEKGYDIFYVSNRVAKTETEGTLKNLKARGFPHADEAHLFLLTNESSKEARRKTIEKTHEIALLIGDNLNDLAQVFEKKGIKDRFGAVDSLRREFGRRFIVLPNPMYGEWENAVYGFQRGLNDEQKNELRKKTLRVF